MNRTYIILINCVLRPLSDSELIDFEKNFFSGAIQLRWAEREVRGKEILLRISINIEMSEVEWLHCERSPQIRRNKPFRKLRKEENEI